jgi:hypothetical protein
MSYLIACVTTELMGSIYFVPLEVVSLCNWGVIYVNGWPFVVDNEPNRQWINVLV